MSDQRHLLDLPPDTAYFLDESQLRNVDLSSVELKRLLEVQGNINAMMQLIDEAPLAENQYRDASGAVHTLWEDEEGNGHARIDFTM